MYLRVRFCVYLAYGALPPLWKPDRTLAVIEHSETDATDREFAVSLESPQLPDSHRRKSRCCVSAHAIFFFIQTFAGSQPFKSRT